MIQDIENFKPDLGIEGLGNFSDVIVLEQRRIEVYQPGPDTRFGKSNGSLLFSPNGSPPLPNVGVSGKPSCTFRIPPICQPFVRCANNGFSDLLPGICQLPLITKTRPIL